MIILTLLLLISSVVLYYGLIFHEFNKFNLPYNVGVLPFGNVWEIVFFRKAFLNVVQDAYMKFKKAGAKCFGFFIINIPIVVAVDLDLLKNIYATDFNTFPERLVYEDQDTEPLMCNIVYSSKDQWRTLRPKLVTAFTKAKIKAIVPTFMEVGGKIKDVLEQHAIQGKIFDVKEHVANINLDITRVYLFEIHSSSDPDNSFYSYCKRLSEDNFLLTVRLVLHTIYPNFTKKYKLPYLKQNLTKHFLDMVEHTINYRRENNVKRTDILQILMDMEDPDGKKMTNRDIAGQIFAFFLGDFETNLTLVSYIMYELALDPEIQEKVRRDISDVVKKYPEGLTYEAIKEMRYLRMVIDEGLRKYCSYVIMVRKCMENYKVDDGFIPKDKIVLIPVHAIHHDPEFYPEPDKFIPERFNEENKKNIKQYTYLPFGEGPRKCLAYQLGILQAAIVIMSLLDGYRFSLNKETKPPLVQKHVSYSFKTKQTILLDVEKL